MESNFLETLNNEDERYWEGKHDKCVFREIGMEIIVHKHVECLKLEYQWNRDSLSL